MSAATPAEDSRQLAATLLADSCEVQDSFRPRAPTTREAANKEQLYYDGQCPLCVAEMDRLRQLADGELELIDIHGTGDDPGLPDRETLLGTLHLRGAQGEFVSGMDANVAAWEHTRYGWLWRTLRWPLIRQVVDVFYRHWARWRYRRLYGRNPEGV